MRYLLAYLSSVHDDPLTRMESGHQLLVEAIIPPDGFPDWAERNAVHGYNSQAIECSAYST
jgi:hypothetical protein